LLLLLLLLLRVAFFKETLLKVRITWFLDLRF
jgi:hypothetical protein